MNPFADLTAPPSNDGKTLKEWNALGYRVRYGAKASGRNGDGVPTFLEHQVQWDADDEYEDGIGRQPDYHDPGPLNRF